MVCVVSALQYCIVKKNNFIPAEIALSEIQGHQVMTTGPVSSLFR